MNISVSNQLFVFTACALCGIAIGFIFDAFRITRRVVQTSYTAAMVEDGLFWLIATAVFFVCIQYFSSGDLRLFEFLGLFFGAFLYFITISKFVIKASVAIIRFLIRVLTVTAKVVLTPVIIIIRLIGKPLFLVFGISRRKGSAVRRKISQLLLNFKRFYKRI